MILTRITTSTTEPITTAEAARHLREDALDADQLSDLAAYITTVRQDCESRLQRTLVPTTWRLQLGGFGRPATHLPMAPVTGITALQYLAASDGALSTLTADDWQLYMAEPAELWAAPQLSWPATAARPDAVQITYTAGYATPAAVPGPIKSWLELALTDLWQQRARSTDRPRVPQGFADSLLDPYKIWTY